MFKVEIKTENKDYTEYGEFTYLGRLEILRNLEEIRQSIMCGNSCGSVTDINGEKVGKWGLE